MPPVWLQHMAEIEKDTAVLRIIVCVFMESDTICTGQLHINPEIIKTHRIIARRRFLCLLFEGSYRPDRVTAGERKDRYISQVADTRT